MAGLYGVSTPVWAGDPAVEAVRLYEEERFEEAAEQAQRGVDRRPDDPVLQYNLGTIAHRQGDFQRAEQALNEALASADTPLQGAISYNLGNTHFQQGRAIEQASPQEAVSLYERALDDYRLAIRQDQNDDDAKFNFELSERRVKRIREQQTQGGGQSQQGPEQQQDPEEQEGQQAGQQQRQQGSQTSEQEQESAGESAKTDGEEEEGDESSVGARDDGSDGSEEAGADSTGTEEFEETPGGQREQASEPGGQDQRQARQAGEPSGERDAMSKQEALWILDAMRQKEIHVPPEMQQGRARQPVVERDW